MCFKSKCVCVACEWNNFVKTCTWIDMTMFVILQYIPRNMHTVFALLCFVVVIQWLIFPYPSGLLHWHCGNLSIAPMPAKQPWWIWMNTSYEFIMNDCITTTKQSTTKPCAYFLGYTVYRPPLSAPLTDNTFVQFIFTVVVSHLRTTLPVMKYFFHRRKKRWYNFWYDKEERMCVSNWHDWPRFDISCSLKITMACFGNVLRTALTLGII